MNVLFFPYLVFADMHESSGVIHQAEMVKALAAADVNVTALWPKNVNGWKYDVSPFEGLSNVCVHLVEFVKDQDTVAGRFTDDMLKVLKPERSPVIFDAVLSGVPGATLGMKRWLSQTGFSRLVPALVNFFDIVTVPEERAIRGGYSEGFGTEMALLECAGALRAATVVPRMSEKAALQVQLRQWFSPSAATDAMSRVTVVPRPFEPPQGIQRRKWDGKATFELFSARSFGSSAEEGGKQVTPILDAIRALRIKGRDVRLRLYTRSERTAWVEEQIAKYGEALDVRFDRPREEVLQALYECPASIDMRDYCGLYMSSIEALTSGSPHVFKETKWSKDELRGPLWIDSWDVSQISGQIGFLMDEFSSEVERAFYNAKAHAAKRAHKFVGDLLKATIQTEIDRMNPKFGTFSFKGMSQLFEKLPKEVMTLDEMVKVIESRMDSGKLGRYSLSWVGRMLESRGKTIELTGGVSAPSWIVR